MRTIFLISGRAISATQCSVANYVKVEPRDWRLEYASAEEVRRDAIFDMTLQEYLVTPVMFWLLVLILQLLGCVTGARAHSANANFAVFSLAFASLVRSSANRLDCSPNYAPNGTLLKHTLDVNPNMECSWSREFGFLVFLVVLSLLSYALFVLWRWFYLKVGIMRGCLKDPNFIARNAWILLKYKPSMWWFEFFQFVYKGFLAYTAIFLSSARHAWHLLWSHVLATGAVLAFVWSYRPFVTIDANKLQVLALIAELFAYGMGALCLALEGACESNPILEFAICFFSLVIFVVVYWIGGRMATSDEKDDNTATENLLMQLRDENPTVARGLSDETRGGLEQYVPPKLATTQ